MWTRAGRQADADSPGTFEPLQRPGKPAIAWDDRAARDALVSALVNDATTLVAALADAELDQQAAQALALVALVAGQDVEPAEGSDGTDGRWRIARRVAPDRMISTVDPQARHVHKTVHQRQDGYKAHTLRQRPILLTNVVSVLVGFALYANFLGTASYVEAPTETGYGFGVSTLVGGLCMLPGGAAMMALSPVSARLISWRGPRATLILGSLVIALGYLLRIIFTGELWHVLVAATVASAGAAVAYSAMPALILDAIPHDEAAAATGMNTLARGIGTSLASAAATALLSALTVTVAGTTFPARAAFVAFFICGTVTAALAALLMLVVRPSRSPAPLL